VFLFGINDYSKGFEGGSRFARAKRFANASTTTTNQTAKSAIDNGGAGRDAKGENPFIGTKRTSKFLSEFACSYLKFFISIHFHRQSTCNQFI
jgi:hypothetical protein